MRSANATPVSESLFYAVGDGLTLGEHTTGDRPVEGDAHDQDQSFETIGFLDMALHEAEAAAFEVGEHVLDPPAHSIVEYRVFARVGVHRDDPGLLVALLVQDADVGGDAAAVKLGACRFAFQGGTRPLNDFN